MVHLLEDAELVVRTERGELVRLAQLGEVKARPHVLAALRLRIARLEQRRTKRTGAR